MLEFVSEAFDEITEALVRIERLVAAQDQARTDWAPTANGTATQRMDDLVDYIVAGNYYGTYHQSGPLAGQPNPPPQGPQVTWCNQATRIIAQDVGAPWEGAELLHELANVV